MPLDGVTANFLARELDRTLCGGRVEKISQPGNTDLHLRIRRDRESMTLLLSANPSDPRIHLTRESVPNPPVPFRFCTILRKYLTGSRILSVTNPPFERIFRITFQTVNELGDIGSMTLVAEIMGRHSNIVFLNDMDKILDAAIHVDHMTSRVREVLPAHPYIEPPRQDKISVQESLSEPGSTRFFHPVKDAPAAKHIVASIKGFSPLLAGELCHMAAVDPASGILSLSTEEQLRLRTALLALNRMIEAGIAQPSLVYPSTHSPEPCDFHALTLMSFPRVVSADTISSAMDTYYRSRNHQSALQQKKTHLLRLAEKKLENISRKIAVHRQDLLDCNGFEDLKTAGDLIFANLYRLQGGERRVTVVDYYHPDQPDVVVELNEHLTPSQNAQRYFRRYQKQKSKSETVSGFLAEELSQAEYLEGVRIAITNAESEDDIDALKYEFSKVFLLSESYEKEDGKAVRPTKPAKATGRRSIPSEPRRFVSSDGLEILIGRNNLQNESITFHLASRGDLWMHVQKAPGTHTVVRSGKSVPPDRTIEEAAMLTAWYSRKSEGRDTKTIVDYCPVADVKKQKNSTPGHVLYKNFRSITVYARLPESATAHGSSRTTKEDD